MKTYFIDTYTEEERAAFVGVVVNAKHPLRNIEQQHWDQVLHSFRFRGFTYAWRMMSVSLQAQHNSGDTKDESMPERIGFLLNLRDGSVFSTMN